MSQRRARSGVLLARRLLPLAVPALRVPVLHRLLRARLPGAPGAAISFECSLAKSLNCRSKIAKRIAVRVPILHRVPRFPLTDAPGAHLFRNGCPVPGAASNSCRAGCCSYYSNCIIQPPAAAWHSCRRLNLKFVVRRSSRTTRNGDRDGVGSAAVVAQGCGRGCLSRHA